MEQLVAVLLQLAPGLLSAVATGLIVYGRISEQLCQVKAQLTVQDGLLREAREQLAGLRGEFNASRSQLD